MGTHEPTFEKGWSAVLDGDRAAFNVLVAPHVEEMIRAARRDIRYHRFLGDLEPSELTPEELVGEALLRAWRSRRRRPAEVSLRAWLLGIQHRVLQKLIQVEHLERNLWAVSLEDPVPPEPLFDDDESFWEWYQPEDLTRWEDVIPTDLAPAETAPAVEEEETTYGLDPEPRQVLLLHDEHELSLTEVAFATGRSVRETAVLLKEARRSVEDARRGRAE